MSNPFDTHEAGLNSSALGSVAITPSDSADLEKNIRAVTLGASGTLAWVNWQGETQATGTLPSGTYALMAKRILATGTTATGLTGWI